MQRIAYILQKELFQIFRNRIMVFIIIIIPIIQLFVLAHATTFEIKNVKLFVVDLDRSQTSRDLLGKFEGSPFFRIIDYAFSYKIAEEAIKKNEADLIIRIPADFEKELEKDSRSDVQLVANAINNSAASLMNAYALSIIMDFNRNIVVDKLGLSGNPEPIKIDYSFWYNPELDYKAYMVPGILVILVTLIGMFLSAMNIVREKEIGTIEQINVTPIKKYQLIIGKLLPFWFLALIELAIGLTFARFVFDIPIVGSLWLIFLSAGVYLLVMQGLGFFISTFSDTQQQAMFLSFFFVVIFILMSGLFTPIESMPHWAQIINKGNPLAYFIEIMRMMMLKGSRIGNIQTQLFTLLGIAILMLVLATLRYRKTA
ncbi:MAG: ABC transporter permease [Bacteroidota bacterium]|nr:ABC transporter permease [Bacteroidota bacterium]